MLWMRNMAVAIAIASGLTYKKWISAYVCTFLESGRILIV